MEIALKEPVFINFCHAMSSFACWRFFSFCMHPQKTSLAAEVMPNDLLYSTNSVIQETRGEYFAHLSEIHDMKNLFLYGPISIQFVSAES